jgi:PAS domain-containing protein
VGSELSLTYSRRRHGSFDDRRAEGQHFTNPENSHAAIGKLRKLSLDFHHPESQSHESSQPQWMSKQQYKFLPSSHHTNTIHGQTTESALAQRRDYITELEKKASTAEFGDYDLHAPAPKRHFDTTEGMADKLFGESHLRYLLSNKKLRLAFAAFLQENRPSLVLPFVQYLENQKAMAAVIYANSIAMMQKPLPGATAASAAATLSAQFQRNGQMAFEILLSEALPAYITHQLTREVSQYQLSNVPNTKPLSTTTGVDGLSEVFCLSDPNLKDHPIIYASKEFFKLTQYGREYSIGRNCRFLQGPKTSREATGRLSEALQNGREINETILNYRRDGSPFFNLLLVTPLHDNCGRIRVGLAHDEIRDNLG